MTQNKIRFVSVQFFKNKHYNICTIPKKKYNFAPHSVMRRALIAYALYIFTGGQVSHEVPSTILAYFMLVPATHKLNTYYYGYEITKFQH